MSLSEQLLVRPGAKINLKKLDAGRTHGVREGERTDAATQKLAARVGELTAMLGADGRFGVVVVLQGMDTSGKDGTIRRVFAGVDPQFMRVWAFKRPTDEELSHDFLWRVHRQTPGKGELVVFNRSHYEDVGIVRVHGLVPREAWEKRFDQINDFERLLSESGTLVLKFFLHISKKEQAERLRARLEDPAKNWKMDLTDLKERGFWEDYMEAYSEALRRCSTKHAPWYVIPADHKWFRTHAVATVIKERMEELGLRYPKPAFDPRKVRVL